MVKPVVKVLHFILIIKNQVLIQLSYLLRKIGILNGEENLYFLIKKRRNTNIQLTYLTEGF